MPTGTPGSTLVAELNRLANGGTYPPISQYVDEALAAKNWALSLGITPTHTDTVGILNEIASIDNGESQWQYLDYNGVCNHIAGTTSLTANAALQTIGGGPVAPLTWETYSPTATWASTSGTLTWATV